jgi:L-aminopeptidase/D-esterase-like protein
MKGGLGSASASLRGGATIGALTVVNAFGDVLERSTGRIIAGMRDSKDGRILPGSANLLIGGAAGGHSYSQNTVISVVATDARLTREDAQWVASVMQDAFSRVVSPCHSRYDGDVTFAASTGEIDEELHHLAFTASELVCVSIERAVKEADGLGAVPSWRDLFGG